MALFHFTVDQMKRSEGQSAIASAAYRSGERLYSEYYGEVQRLPQKGRRNLFRHSLTVPRSPGICRPSDLVECR